MLTEYPTIPNYWQFHESSLTVHELCYRTLKGIKDCIRNIYAPTRVECEEKLAVLIKQMKAEIIAQKASLKIA